MLCTCFVHHSTNEAKSRHLYAALLWFTLLSQSHSTQACYFIPINPWGRVIIAVLLSGEAGRHDNTRDISKNGTAGIPCEHTFLIYLKTGLCYSFRKDMLYLETLSWKSQGQRQNLKTTTRLSILEIYLPCDFQPTWQLTEQLLLLLFLVHALISHFSKAINTLAVPFINGLPLAVPAGLFWS